MKKLLSIFLLLSVCIAAKAQSWQPVGAGLNAGGYVNTLFVYDSLLYAGGSFTSPGNNIAQWNGTTWDSLGSGINNQVFAIANYKGLVYMGGWFSKAGGHSAGGIATWDGSSFANAGFDIEGGSIETLQVYDSLLYIGGLSFDSVNHHYLTTQGIASWDGSIVQAVSPVDTFYGDFYAFCLYGGSLYTGGYIYGPYDYCLLYWNNLYYNCAADYFHSNGTGAQFAMTECNGKLYVGGIFDTAGNKPANNIAEWNGTSCSKLGSGIHGTVYALTSYKNLVFAGGDFDSAGGIPAINIAMWNGAAWSALGNGLNGPVYSLAIFDSTLYAGGMFTSPDNGIAMFAIPSGINELNKKSEVITVYPNPNNGLFAIQLSDASQSLSVEIYNILGEKVYCSTLISENTLINLDKQAEGIYLYRIAAPDGKLIGEGKLVIE